MADDIAALMQMLSGSVNTGGGAPMEDPRIALIQQMMGGGAPGMARKMPPASSMPEEASETSMEEGSETSTEEELEAVQNEINGEGMPPDHEMWQDIESDREYIQSLIAEGQDVGDLVQRFEEYYGEPLSADPSSTPPPSDDVGYEDNYED